MRGAAIGERCPSPAPAAAGQHCPRTGGLPPCQPDSALACWLERADRRVKVYFFFSLGERCAHLTEYVNLITLFLCRIHPRKRVSNLQKGVRDLQNNN